MSEYQRARERIGRQLEGGYLTVSEHRRLARAIDRAEHRAANAAARTAARKQAKQRCYRHTKMRLMAASAGGAHV